MPNPFTLEDAKSPNPDVIRQILELGLDDEVSHTAAQNPACPAPVLAQILERGGSTAEVAASNPSASSASLGLILGRCEDNWLSRNAARHPNAPIRQKLNWMLAHGNRIQRDTAPSRLPPEQSDEPLPSSFAQFIGE